MAELTLPTQVFQGVQGEARVYPTQPVAVQRDAGREPPGDPLLTVELTDESTVSIDVSALAPGLYVLASPNGRRLAARNTGPIGQPSRSAEGEPAWTYLGFTVR